jgi:DNA polymerase
LALRAAAADCEGFRFTVAERGKRRIHQAPNRGQVRACLPWLTAELAAIKPELVVCLGATAAQAVFGPDFRLTRHRGDLRDAPASVTCATRPRRCRANGRP